MGNAIKNWEKKQRQEQKKEMAKLNAVVGAVLFKHCVSSVYGDMNSPYENYKKEEKEG